MACKTKYGTCYIGQTGFDSKHGTNMHTWNITLDESGMMGRVDTICLFHLTFSYNIHIIIISILSLYDSTHFISMNTYKK